MLAARKPLCVFKTSFLKIIPRNIKPYLFAKALRSGPPRFFRRCFLEPCSAAAGHLGLDKESHAVEIEDVRHVTMDCLVGLSTVVDFPLQREQNGAASDLLHRA